MNKHCKIYITVVNHGRYFGEEVGKLPKWQYMSLTFVNGDMNGTEESDRPRIFTTDESGWEEVSWVLTSENGRPQAHNYWNKEQVGSSEHATYEQALIFRANELGSQGWELTYATELHSTFAISASSYSSYVQRKDLMFKRSLSG